MEQLSTIQKRGNLNKIYATGEAGNGDAYHNYTIVKNLASVIGIGKGGVLVHEADVVGELHFQDGPRNLGDSTCGVIDTDLLEIVRHRLQCFQSGPFTTRENACALTHIEEALMWLNKRVEDRIERNVLGTNNK